MPNQESPLRPSLMDTGFCWEAGLLLRVGGTVCLVAELGEPLLSDPLSQSVVLESQPGKERRVAQVGDLNELLRRGELSLISGHCATSEQLIELLAKSDEERTRMKALPLTGKTPATVIATLEKIRWLSALHGMGYQGFKPGDLWEQDIRFLSKKFDLPLRSRQTLAKWEKVATDNAANLVPNFDGRGGVGLSRLDGMMEEKLSQVIQSAKSGQVKLQPKAIESELIAKLCDGNSDFASIKTPSLSTVRRRFHACVSPFERAVAKFGVEVALRRHQPSGGRMLATSPGLVYEFDDKDTGLFLVDERTGLGWGRPWITAGVCQASRFPVGLHMDNKPRSAHSAVSCLVNAIEPKDQNELTAISPKLTWEAYGFPAQVWFDNALQNDQRIVSLGVDVADPSWARAYRPKDKREIEYFNCMLQSWVRTLPGWRGVKGDPDALKEGQASAIFNMSQFRQMLFRWMLLDYSNGPMEDGRTPRQRYLHEGGIDLRPRIPPDISRLRILRTIQLPNPSRWGANGIRLFGLAYQSDELYHRWIRRPGGSLNVHVRFDPETLAHILVAVPEGDCFLKLPCCYPEYASNLTLYQQKLVLKMCRQLKKSNPSLLEMYKARSDLREMTCQLAKSKKMKERRLANRTGDVEIPGEALGSEVVSELEHEYDQLDKVEMDTADEGWAVPAF